MNFFKSLFTAVVVVASGGWAALGALAASAVLGGTQKQGRLDSLKVTLSEEGVFIPFGFGRWRQGANLVWSPGLVESVKRKGGFFGLGGTKVYYYSGSFGFLVCEGPITRVRRILLGDKVFYDYNDGDEKGFELDQDGDDNHFFNKTTGLTDSLAKAHVAAGIGLRIYVGHAEQKVDAAIEDDKGAELAPAYANRVLIVIENLSLADYGNGVPNITVEVDNNTVSDVDEIIENIAARVGLTADDLDLTALDGLSVVEEDGDGFVVASRATAAAALQQLMDAHHFRLVEADGVLRAVLLNTSSAVTLAESELRQHLPGEATAQPSWSDADERSLPEVVEVTYFDAQRSYHTGHVFGRIGQTVVGRRKESLSLTMAMRGDRAQRIARIRANQQRLNARSFPLALGVKHLYLAPGDLVTLPASLGSGTALIGEMTIPLFGPITAAAARHDTLIYDAPLPDLPEGVNGPQANSLAENSYVVVDGVLPFDYEKGLSRPAVFVFATAAYDTVWRGVNADWIFLELNGDADFGIFRPSTMGTAVGALGDFEDGSYGVDETASLTVDFIGGADPATATLDELLEGPTVNLAYYGAPGRWEVVQFMAAVYDGPGSPAGKRRFVLTGFRRGHRGSEANIANHEAGDNFIVIDPLKMQPVYVPVDILNTENEIKYYVDGDEQDSDLITPTGVNMMPLSPDNVTAERDGSDHWQLAWERRTRRASNYGGSGTDNGLDAHDLMKFQVAILDGAAEVRSITVTDEAATYTAAQQVTDFGSVQDEITVRIYQMSDIVGRGWPAERTFEV
jgi:hypothetical protein